MIDSVFINWFAFEYDKNGEEEFLKDKNTTIIATCDIPWNIYLKKSNWT